MQQITFHCETITPMFLAGADGTTPELRPPSIKGALRFWWRAINGHLTLEELRAQEGAIFGDTTKRSKVIIQVSSRDLIESEDLLPQDKSYNQNTTGTNKEANILEYLAYGVVAKPRSIERSYFLAGGHFDVRVQYPDEFDEKVKDSFGLINFFGGIGSRSRNGYGCVSIDNLNVNAEELFKKYKKGKLKNYTAFSEKARLFKGNTLHAKWGEALFEVGSAYRSARLALENRHEGRQRKMISQPFAIYNKNTGKSDKFPLWMQDQKLERNAKCFFIGVSKEATGYRGRILYLPHTLDSLPDYLNPNNKLANHIAANLTEIL